MTNLPEIITNNGKNVRTAGTVDAPLFMSKDLVEGVGAVWKGYDSIKHVPEEFRVQSDWTHPKTGTVQAWYFTELGLYFYLNRSDKPAALPWQIRVAEILREVRAGNLNCGNTDRKIDVEGRTIPIPAGTNVSSIAVSKAGSVTVKFQMMEITKTRYSFETSVAKEFVNKKPRPKRKSPRPALLDHAGSVQKFIEKHCEISSEYWTASVDLWEAWLELSQDKSISTMNSKAAFFRAFNHRIDRKKVMRTRRRDTFGKSFWGYLGIRIKPPEAQLLLSGDFE